MGWVNELQLGFLVGLPHYTVSYARIDTELIP